MGDKREKNTHYLISAYYTIIHRYAFTVIHLIYFGCQTSNFEFLILNIKMILYNKNAKNILSFRSLKASNGSDQLLMRKKIYYSTCLIHVIILSNHHANYFTTNNSLLLLNERYK